MKDMCSQIRSHRAMMLRHIHIPRVMTWNHRVSPLNHRVLPWAMVHRVLSWAMVHRVLSWAMDHRALPWAMDFCPFRACNNDIVFAAPKALPWAMETIGLSARSYTPTRPGYARPERAMSSITQGNALGVCTCHSIVALKGQKYTAQGNALRERTTT